ncbi:hypothetical protein [Microtetraspora glauca]|uniref:Uncharacterized protein n=1 Tax=Microtetraspora glauca TaxID=1996 RepID=A0ABV3GAE1_MICGL
MSSGPEFGDRLWDMPNDWPEFVQHDPISWTHRAWTGLAFDVDGWVEVPGASPARLRPLRPARW